MALVTCPECTQRISDRAVTCPHCGLLVGNFGACANTTISAPAESGSSEQPALASAVAVAPDDSQTQAWPVWAGRYLGAATISAVTILGAMVAYGEFSLAAWLGLGAGSIVGGWLLLALANALYRFGWSSEPIFEGNGGTFCTAIGEGAKVAGAVVLALVLVTSIAGTNRQGGERPYSKPGQRMLPSQMGGIRDPLKVPAGIRSGAEQLDVWARQDIQQNYWRETICLLYREAQAIDQLDQTQTTAAHAEATRSKLQGIVAALRKAPPPRADAELVALVREIAGVLQTNIEVSTEIEKLLDPAELKRPAGQGSEKLERFLNLPDADDRLAKLPEAEQAVFRRLLATLEQLQEIDHKVIAMQKKLEERFGAKFEVPELSDAADMRK